jgi:hypothetical protein
LFFKRSQATPYVAASLLPGQSTMFFKLFRKPAIQPDPRPRFEQDPTLTEELTRRINSIEFHPRKGFLKDQPVPKRVSPQGRLRK